LADITIKKIYEEVPEEEESTITQNENIVNELNKLWVWIIVAVIVLLIGVSIKIKKK